MIYQTQQENSHLRDSLQSSTNNNSKTAVGGGLQGAMHSSYHQNPAIATNGQNQSQTVIHQSSKANQQRLLSGNQAYVQSSNNTYSKSHIHAQQQQVSKHSRGHGSYGTGGAISHGKINK